MLQLQAIVVTITTCNMRYEFEIMEEKKKTWKPSLSQLLDILALFYLKTL